MVDADLVVKVADFGLSRHLDESKQKVKRSLQTSLIPSTSTPESIARLIFNEKTDVWSYGSLLLELFDCDIDTVLERILDLSTLYQSIDPNERPTFAALENEVSRMLTADDFEPIRDSPHTPCKVSPREVSPPEATLKQPGIVINPR